MGAGGCGCLPPGWQGPGEFLSSTFWELCCHCPHGTEAVLVVSWTSCPALHSQCWLQCSALPPPWPQLGSDVLSETETCCHLCCISWGTSSAAGTGHSWVSWLGSLLAPVVRGVRLGRRGKVDVTWLMPPHSLASSAPAREGQWSSQPRSPSGWGTAVACPWCGRRAAIPTPHPSHPCLLQPCSAAFFLAPILSACSLPAVLCGLAGSDSSVY